MYIQNALALHKNNTSISVAQIQQALSNVSVTFARITQVTQQSVAAKYKNSVSIVKVTTANVQLFNNINAYNSVYKRAVQRSAAKLQQAANANVDNFVVSSTNNVHDANCYSIVTNSNTNNVMLYARFLRSKTVYLINNVVATKQQVAQYCTASVAAKLLQKDNVVHNKTNNVLHNVVIRTPSLHNIVALQIRKQLLFK